MKGYHEMTRGGNFYIQKFLGWIGAKWFSYEFQFRALQKSNKVIAISLVHKPSFSLPKDDIFGNSGSTEFESVYRGNSSPIVFYHIFIQNLTTDDDFLNQGG